MIISNNIAAQTILNETNRNLKKSSKLAEKLSTGTKITSAGDDAAGYTISERMRVKLRALNQDDNNVKSGKDMLTVASGAVQSQMNILRTIKERVIDANNDTNTDTDRKIIQREIDEYYDQMSTIAYDTDFNGKKLLVGGEVDQVVESWEVLKTAVLADDSEIPGLLPDATEPTLDGEPGLFATFGKDTDDVQWDGYNKKDDTPETWSECAVSNTNGANFVGGTPNKSTIIEMDLSTYNIAALDNTSFRIETSDEVGRIFVLTTDTTRDYQCGQKIDISGCTKPEEIVAKIKAAAEGITKIKDDYDITLDGGKITFTTKLAGKDANDDSKYNVKGQNIQGGTIQIGANTGLQIPPSFSGGKDETSHLEWRLINEADTDLGYHWVSVTDNPAEYATCTIKGINTLVGGSGITIKGESDAYLVFVDGDTGFAYNDANNYYVIGKDFNGEFSFAGIKFNLSGGTLKATAKTAGTKGNSFSLVDGIQHLPNTIIKYTDAQPLTGMKKTQEGKNGDTAHWDMDLSAYDTTDPAKAEELIKKYVGKAIGVNGTSIEFIDSGSSSGMDALYKIKTNTIDLNDVRKEVAGGTTVAEAFENLLKRWMTNVEAIKATDDKTIIGVRFLSEKAGDEGNSDKMISQIGELRHYTIDWQNWVNTQNITDIPAALHEKGIRFYCPTDGSQWVNVRFVNGLTDNDEDRPDSGTDKQDIKTLTIDVEGITDTKDLVKKLMMSLVII